MIREFAIDDADAVLALNAANVPAVGVMDAAKLAKFAGLSPFFKVLEWEGQVAGMLIGLTQAEVAYESPNFQWFRARYERFAYVDRIALAPAARGRGLGPKLYREFVAWAVARDLPRLCAEVNTEPPNPRSMRFHELFGFEDVARCRPYKPEEEVAMLVKEIG